MGRHLTKMVFLVLMLHFLISSSSGAAVKPNENGVCISKGGRFPPYESEGKPPKPADREFKDLNLCNMFHGNTCCSASQMHSASLAVKNLEEIYSDCSRYFELLECSICHPMVGTESGHPPMCSWFCDVVFDACDYAYFSSDSGNQVITPCRAHEDIICGIATEWVSNGTEFCDALGFTVQTAASSEVEPCYGINSRYNKPVKESLIKIENSTKQLRMRQGFGTVVFAWFQDLDELVREMTLVQVTSWVVTLFAIEITLFNRRQQMLEMIEGCGRRLINMV